MAMTRFSSTAVHTCPRAALSNPGAAGALALPLVGTCVRVG
jgi:hypothetical protein